MKQPRRIDFTLIFDAADGLWPSINSFDMDISRFFRDKGIEAVVVKDVEGTRAEYTLFLSKIEEIKNMPKAKPLSPGKQVDNIRKQIGRK